VISEEKLYSLLAFLSALQNDSGTCEIEGTYVPIKDAVKDDFQSRRKYYHIGDEFEGDDKWVHIPPEFNR
jgi:hypothetical protein